ncbi:pentapeptide repeat-containing protein [Bifidobacterium adolescentis]|uniref:pentapeptide repeat-containing protein n=1 Tax=Bifidobacterium adolescentis TaxID=1680 RepID=UPI0022E3A815|nr:pentapeptide repeat-containing protein [Bifidobacterium adolescentis]
MKITTPNGTLEGESIEAILKEHGLDCLRSADLSAADLSDADLHGADLRCANLRDADLRDADLSDADLSGADLRSAYLSAADLSDADLSAADLRCANLRDADLSAANLRCADLRSADLSAADLSGADLHGANLRSAYLSAANLRSAYLSAADLRSADLSAADLRGANLHGANLSELTVAQTSILPDEGDIIGWKKAITLDGAPIIVKLLIPADAQRSNATGRKCRASTARVLDLQDKQGNSLPPDTTAYSSYDPDFTYQKGETVHVEDFDTNRWDECAPGIHFFITRIEAIEY